MRLKSLIRTGKAPPGAIVPQPIEKEGLFKLDVDDEIWQDVGLEDDTEGPVPRWLGDESVRKGIKLMLLLDRCKEEEARLRKERRSMQEWMREEWACLQAAIGNTGMVKLLIIY
jgi:hypothetical protein